MERISFNKGWKVWKDMDPFELVFRVQDDAQAVDLPHDAMFHEEQKQGAANGGYTGNIDAGEYKYYKQFYVPEEYQGGHVMLQFEGIYRNACVFVNQSKVGESAYGYTDFTVDIGDYLQYGADNDILVAVKCGTRSSRWYSGAGIYRDVWLVRGGSLYVKPYGLRMTTLDVDKDGALVCISARIHNDSLSAGTVQVNVSIRELAGTAVANNTYPVRIGSRQTLEFRKNIYIDHAKLWDDITPNLYQVVFTVTDQSGAQDVTEITSGIRKLSVDSRHGLRVNGRGVKLRGACIHHDQGILGTATYDDYEYRDRKSVV